MILKKAEYFQNKDFVRLKKITSTLEEVDVIFFLNNATTPSRSRKEKLDKNSFAL
jgi:hypothetical protein